MREENKFEWEFVNNVLHITIPSNDVLDNLCYGELSDRIKDALSIILEDTSEESKISSLGRVKGL